MGLQKRRMRTIYLTSFGIHRWRRPRLRRTLSTCNSTSRNIRHCHLAPWSSSEAVSAISSRTGSTLADLAVAKKSLMIQSLKMRTDKMNQLQKMLAMTRFGRRVEQEVGLAPKRKELLRRISTRWKTCPATNKCATWTRCLTSTQWMTAIKIIIRH